MTAAELQDIFQSSGFRAGLQELSSYLASIMQEGPIVHLLAKCLWQKRHLFALERNKRHDLTVWMPDHHNGENKTTIEFKFNYETCAVRLRKELRKLADGLGSNPTVPARKVSNWDVMHRIFKDIYTKNPDMFVWIICSRDLSGISDNDLKRIVNWKPLKKYRRTHAYKADREFLSTIDSFLEILQRFRIFSVSTAEIEVNGFFPSTYHFRICELTRP